MPAESPNWTTFLGMGATAAGAIVAGLALGWFADSAAGTTPVFIMVGLLLGVVGAVYYVIVQFRSLMKE